MRLSEQFNKFMTTVQWRFHTTVHTTDRSDVASEHSPPPRWLLNIENIYLHEDFIPVF